MTEEKSFIDRLTLEDVLIHRFRPASEGGEWKDVIDIDTSASLREALDLMRKNSIRSVAVYQKNKNGDKDYYAIVSVFDVLCWFAWKTDENNSENLQMSALIGVTEESKTLWTYPSIHNFHVLLEPFSKGVHTILVRVLKDGKDVYYILTQSDIVRFLNDNSERFDDKVLNATLEESGLLGRKAITMDPSESPKHGFQTMWKEQVTALPVVDKDGRILSTLSTMHLRSFADQQFEEELEGCKVLDFLKAREQDHEKRLVRPDTTLKEALSRVSEYHHHHLWVVDEDNKPTHSVTLSDLICKFSLYDYYK